MYSRVEPVVEVEEDVYTYVPAGNGADPLWCMGGTTLARVGDDLFTTGLETLPGIRPLNNCRWTLLRRRDGGQGWETVYVDTGERTREPCPVGCFADGHVWVSTNPARTPAEVYAGPAEPRIVEFAAQHPAMPRGIHHPRWSEPAPFGEHSYRSFAADRARQELWLAHNIGYDRAYWSFRDHRGDWSACGSLAWPWGADYATPQPIRICYPCVALHERAVHVFGVSDIEEPNPDFKAFKFQLTGQEWDYDFRRLFYTWTPDVTALPFRPWIELASREATCGWMYPCDVSLGDAGRVHLLWHERNCDVRLRDRFFPGTPLTHALEYAVLQEGRMVRRSTLVLHREGQHSDVPLYGRFHDAGGEDLYAVAVLRPSGGAPADRVNRVARIREDGSPGAWTHLSFRHAFKHPFFTASPRAGNGPSGILDVLGCSDGRPDTIRYARVRLNGG